MKPNFIVVEGHCNTVDLDSIYEDFKVDYMNPMISADQLRRKYELEPRDYKTLRVRVSEETGLKRKPAVLDSLVNTTMNIYELKNSYGVRKYVDGFMEYFGQYPDLDTAKMVRDKLYECNWDRQVANQLEKEYGVVNPRKLELKDRLDEFKYYYADTPTHHDDILKKMHISSSTYSELRALLREKYPNIKKKRVSPKRGTYRVNHRPNRYIKKNGDYWRIIKWDKCYGNFKRLEDAVNHRNYLETRGWKID